MSWLEVVGCGPGGIEYVTPAARKALTGARFVIGWKRCLELFPEAKKYWYEAAGVEKTIELIRTFHEEYITEKAVVLVSGDVGIFSLARQLVEIFGIENCHITPGISALQVACARLGFPWHDALIVDAHAHIPPEAVEHHMRERRISVVYLDRGEGRSWAARTAKCLAHTHNAYLCERLTLENERVRAASAEDIEAAEFPSLVVFHKQSDR